MDAWDEPRLGLPPSLTPLGLGGPKPQQLQFPEKTSVRTIGDETDDETLLEM